MKKRILFARIDRSTLTKSQKRILRHIIGLLPVGSDLLYAGLDGIASRLDITRKTVRVAFRAFEEAGVLILVHKEKRGGIPRTYRLDFTPFEGGQLFPSNPLGDIVPPKCSRISNTPKARQPAKTSQSDANAAKSPPAKEGGHKPSRYRVAPCDFHPGLETLQ